MKFFQKIREKSRQAKQEEYAKAQRKYFYQRQKERDEELRKSIARRQIEDFLSWGVEELSQYTNKAAQIALEYRTIYPDLGRKEILSLAYQSVLKNLNTEEYLIKKFTRRFDSPEEQFYRYLTKDDHQQFLIKRQKAIRAIIDRLDRNIQADHQRLIEKQEIVQTIRQQLDQIREKQALQEKDLDQKILAIDQQIEKVQALLSLKARPTPQDFDFDRMEKMIETLRKLKNE